MNVFSRYGGWLHRLGIDSVGVLNDAIEGDKIRKIILVSEALHEQRIAELAAQIAEKSEDIDIILIAFLRENHLLQTAHDPAPGQGNLSLSAGNG
jgi:uridine kinase